MNYTILQGDNRTTLKTLADNSIDAIITDPPYGIDFLGKSWDANTGALETYQECLRVLKPGGHILAFSAARTYHHLAVTLEQAGFEIRDQIMWIYSSGFPKSQDIGRQIQKKLGVKEYKEVEQPLSAKHNSIYEHGARGEGKTYDKVVVTDSEAVQWQGWGTALKPAHEPIALARKPIKTSIRENCLKYGTGALNIDATRIEVAEDEMESFQGNWDRVNAGMGEYAKLDGSIGHGAGQLADQMKDISGYKPQGRFPSNVVGEIEGYQKYFYCPKVSRKERHIGHEMPPPMFGNVQGAYGPDGNRMAVGFDNRATGKTKKHDPLGHLPTTRRARDAEGNVLNYAEKKAGASATMLAEQFQSADGPTGNNHPTVKPIELMKYLIKLVTPPGGTVLDPFNGSGSTGCAAVELGHTYIGCELDPAYVEIAKKRILAWYEHTRDPAKELFE